MNLDVDTDANGTIQQRITYNTPGPFDVTVTLVVTLLEPPDTVVTGELDIDGANGRTTNPAKSFRLQTGARLDLGSWHLDGGDNVIVLRGQTEPARANTRLRVQLDASL